MKTAEEIKELKTPIIAIDKTLNKRRGTVMFPEKLAKANKMLETAKIPASKV